MVPEGCTTHHHAIIITPTTPIFCVHCESEPDQIMRETCMSCGLPICTVCVKRQDYREIVILLVLTQYLPKELVSYCIAPFCCL